MSEGVRFSQVVPYVARLAERGADVTLHSFEKEEPPEAVAARLSEAGVRWRPCASGAQERRVAWLWDVVRLFRKLGEMRPTELTLLTPSPTP